MEAVLDAFGSNGHLWRRVWEEFLEMPGLRLTAAQASRLWGTDVASSRLMLDALVDAAVLRNDNGLYMRADGGSVPV